MLELETGNINMLVNGVLYQTHAITNFLKNEQSLQLFEKVFKSLGPKQRMYYYVRV